MKRLLASLLILSLILGCAGVPRNKAKAQRTHQEWISPGDENYPITNRDWKIPEDMTEEERERKEKQAMGVLNGLMLGMLAFTVIGAMAVAGGPAGLLLIPALGMGTP